jgi:hypothetical protein
LSETYKYIFVINTSKLICILAFLYQTTTSELYCRPTRRTSSEAGERFYKADKSHNREVEGSGLGLAIVRRVVDLHGGRIEVESSPGAGTAVTVILPRT